MIKIKIDDIPSDQPISSLLHKGTGSFKKLAKTPWISKIKSQGVSASSADLKSLADAVIKVLPFSNPFSNTLSTNFSLDRLPHERLTLKKNSFILIH